MQENKVDQALKMPGGKEFERDLTAHMERSADVTLVMTDLDRFMRVNEQFGTGEGDRALIETGEYVMRALPGEARTYRYGGDQFATIFPETFEKEDVFLIMESARKGYRVVLPDGSEQTVSIGIATVPEDGGTYLDIVRKAEGAMYRGKLNGHNKVCLAREEKMVTKTSHYTSEQLKRLTKVSKREGIGEAVLLREALDALLKKYDA